MYTLTVEGESVVPFAAASPPPNTSPSDSELIIPIIPEEMFPKGINVRPTTDLTKYVVYITCFANSNNSDSTSQPLAESVFRKLLHRGCYVFLVTVLPSIRDARELLKIIGQKEKALLVQIGSTETTRHIKAVCEAFNETNFVVPDALDESPIGEKIFDDLELGAIIPNPIDIKSVLESLDCPFRLYHDQDRFLFNYFYAQGLRAVESGEIGGCVFVQAPSFYSIPCKLQASFVFDLIEKLLQLPQFN